jgi:iron(III) transport system substrate-binding protein
MTQHTDHYRGRKRQSPFAIANWKKGIAAVSLAATGALVSACAGTTQVASASTKQPTLVVYSAQGYDSTVVNAFHKATGIPVSLDDDSTGPLLTKVQAEIGHPQWGVLWVDGDTAFASLDKQGQLLRNWEPNVQFNALGKATIPKDKSYIPTGVTMAGTLVYNSAVVKNPPKTWSQLLSSEWKGQIGMNDPAVSGPTYPFVAGMMNELGGVSKGENFYSQLKANGMQIFQTNGDTLHALQTGQIKLALIQSSAGIGAGFQVSTIKTAYLAPSTLIPGVIGIDRHVSKAEQAEAKKFVEYVLSKKGQAVQKSGDPTGDSLYWPVLKGVAPKAGVPSINKIKYQHINPYLWGSRENTVNTWFTNNIVQ